MQPARGSRSAAVTLDVRFLPIYNPEVTRAFRSRRCHKYAALCVEILDQVRRLVIDQQGITASRLKTISLGGALFW
jgi:hypothetical protein